MGLKWIQIILFDSSLTQHSHQCTAVAQHFHCLVIQTSLLLFTQKKYFVHIYWLKNRIKCLFVFCYFLIFFSYIYKIDLNKQVRIVLLFLSPPDTHTQTPLPYETIKYRVWTYFNMTCSVMWHVYLVIWVSFRLSGVLLVSPLFVLDYVPGW